MKRILVLKTDTTEVGMLNHMATEFAACLRAQGAQVDVWDYDDRDISKVLAYCGEPFDAVVGFHNTLLHLFLPKQNRYLMEFLEGKKFNFWFDHPAFCHELMQQVPPTYTALTLDGNYVDFIKTYYPKVTDAILLPPGGEDPGISPVTPEEWNAREFEMIHLATYQDYRPRMREVKELPEQMRPVVEGFVEYLQVHPNVTAEAALKQVLSDYGVPSDPEVFLQWFDLVRPLILTVAGYYREKVVQTLVEAAIPVTVFGDEWKAAPFAEQACLQIHPRIPAEEASGIYSRARWSLNVMTWHKGGFTERIAESMLAGAVALTDRTEYLETHFTCEKELLWYDLANLEALPQNYFVQMKNGAQIARTGQMAARAGHTWSARAREFLALLER